MMSTPAETSVESVRENRAIVTLSTTGPIFGTLSLNRSHCLRPGSVFFHLRKPKIDRPRPGKMM